MFLFGGARPNYLAKMFKDDSLQEMEFASWPHGLLDRVYYTWAVPDDTVGRIFGGKHYNIHGVFDDFTRVMKKWHPSKHVTNYTFWPDDSWEKLTVDEWWGAYERMGWHMMQFALKRPDSPE